MAIFPLVTAGIVSAALGSSPAAVSPTSRQAKTVGCSHSTAVVTFSRRKYPHIIAHIHLSWRRGYPRVLRINRVGADARRDALLRKYPPRPGFDRDEAPAAVLRSTVRADVAYVRSSENRSAGASLGGQIRRYCDGARVRYRFIA